MPSEPLPRLEGGEVVPQTLGHKLVRSTRLRRHGLSSTRPTPHPPTALFPFLWWFLARACWFQLGLGWRRPACSLHFVVWPLRYQMLWDFSGARGGKESPPVWPQGVAGIRKEAGSQTLIMLSLVYVQ